MFRFKGLSMKKIIMTMLVLMGMQQTVDAEIRNMDLVATVVGVGGTAWALKLRSEYKALEERKTELKGSKASMDSEEYEAAMHELDEKYEQLKRKCKRVAGATGALVGLYAIYRGTQWYIGPQGTVAEAQAALVAQNAASEAHNVLHRRLHPHEVVNGGFVHLPGPQGEERRVLDRQCQRAWILQYRARQQFKDAVRALPEVDRVAFLEGLGRNPDYVDEIDEMWRNRLDLRVTNFFMELYYFYRLTFELA